MSWPLNGGVHDIDVCGLFSELCDCCRFGESMGGGLIMAQLAWPTPWVVIIGSFLSTSGAAIQCLVGWCLLTYRPDGVHRRGVYLLIVLMVSTAVLNFVLPDIRACHDFQYGRFAISAQVSLL